MRHIQSLVESLLRQLCVVFALYRLWYFLLRDIGSARFFAVGGAAGQERGVAGSEEVIGGRGGGQVLVVAQDVVHSCQSSSEEHNQIAFPLQRARARTDIRLRRSGHRAPIRPADHHQHHRWQSTVRF